MDEFLIERRGSGGNGLVKYGVLLVSGCLMIGTLVSLIVWTSSLSNFQGIIQESIDDTDIAQKNIKELNYLLKRCPANATLLNGGCVQVFKDKLTFTSARDSCKKFRGDLTVLSTNKQFEDTIKYLKSINMKPQLWVGGQFNHNHGKWEWLEGTEIPKDSQYWGMNQPQVNDEHCIVLDDDYGLHDYPCTDVIWYMCSLPLEY